VPCPFAEEVTDEKIPVTFNPKNGVRQKNGKRFLLRPNWDDRDVNGGLDQRDRKCWLRV